MRIFKYYILLIGIGFCSIPLQAQIIFTESLAPIIDTTKVWQGSIAPELNFKTEKDNFFQVKNNANVSILLSNKRAFTLLNQIEIATSGNTVNVSNGFVHTEYRYLAKPRWEIYPFTEAVWVPSRGLLLRIASGVQSRYRLIQSEHFIWTGGIGFFYEYEKWNMDGVPNLVVPNETRIQQTIKARLAMGVKILFTEKWNFTTSGYIHSRLDSNVANPRFAYSFDLKHHFTNHLGVWLSYQAIQHTKPIFPIKKLYVVITGGVFFTW
ncbi:DUF481 domain-containing protein [Capnocytophaga sputigena]|jgi:hypothetical protein|uniref:Uncharacterized protein n=1 Tax=Capnocytophaga sputigena TaxID=1019 RepID=A0A2A3N4C6_CAPSP|nr:DUF481 domain-containing protein [Capnocytophaga sputigena]ATA78817.1 hypothetical protein CGC59_03610 [Capnocytophaga sputigena]PBN46577.1 hypothetical protein CDC50_11325 [Capnocytophaga sputigena]